MGMQKFVKHDCVDSILKTVRDCPKEVVTVVSTWSDESASKLRVLTEALGDRVVISDQPSQPEENGKPITNDYRQFWSTLQGVNMIFKECDFVLKIRTDQVIDIDKLIHEFNWLVENKPDAFFIPNFKTDSPFWLGDFYFGAEKGLMRETLQLLCANDGRLLKEKGGVHRNFYRAFAKARLGQNRVPLNRTLFFQPKEYLLGVWPGLVISSEELFSTIIWRGEKIELGTSSTYKFQESCDGGKSPKSTDLIVAYARNVLIIWLREISRLLSKVKVFKRM